MFEVKEEPKKVLKCTICTIGYYIPISIIKVNIFNTKNNGYGTICKCNICGICILD